MKEKVRERLVELGFDASQIAIILRDDVISRSKETTILEHIDENYKFFQGHGITDEELHKIIPVAPSLLCVYSKKNLIDKMDNLRELGHSYEDTIEILVRAPVVYTNSPATVAKRKEIIRSLGYNDEQAIKMANSYPEIYSVPDDCWQECIIALTALGYSESDIL